jgi:hypothetical protein
VILNMKCEKKPKKEEVNNGENEIVIGNIKE